MRQNIVVVSRRLSDQLPVHRDHVVHGDVVVPQVAYCLSLLDELRPVKVILRSVIVFAVRVTPTDLDQLLAAGLDRPRVLSRTVLDHHPQNSSLTERQLPLFPTLKYMGRAFVTYFLKFVKTREFTNE